MIGNLFQRLWRAARAVWQKIFGSARPRPEIRTRRAIYTDALLRRRRATSPSQAELDRRQRALDERRRLREERRRELFGAMWRRCPPVGLAASGVDADAILAADAAGDATVVVTVERGGQTWRERVDRSTLPCSFGEFGWVYGPPVYGPPERAVVESPLPEPTPDRH